MKQVIAIILSVILLAACSTSYEQRRPLAPVPSYPPPGYEPLPQAPAYPPMDQAGPAPYPPASGGFQEFVGARAGQAEMGLNNRGYRLVRTEGLTAFWWNPVSETCLQIVTGNGRYQSVDPVNATSCLESGSVAPSTPPIVETSRPAIRDVRTGSASDENACLRAVAIKAKSSVVVLSSQASAANTLVMVGVGSDEAPWRCVISGGTVQEISFAGSEGRL